MESDISKYVNEEFDKNALPSLMGMAELNSVEYIKIPNGTPDFDPEWDTNGHAQKACDHLVNWIKAQVPHPIDE